MRTQTHYLPVCSSVHVCMINMAKGSSGVLHWLICNFLSFSFKIFISTAYILYFSLSIIFTCFNNGNIDLSCDTIYIQWFVFLQPVSGSNQF
jgi:hypothetical protein